MGYRGRGKYDPARRAMVPESTYGVPFSEEIVTEAVNDNRAAIAEAMQTRTGRTQEKGVPIELPDHQFIPKNVPSLDFRKACAVPPGSTFTSPYVLYAWTCPPGSVARFTHYAVYCDGLDADLLEFLITVDGNRVFPYHGDPSNNFKINLGLGPDLSNICLIPANLAMFPGQTLKVACVNTDPAVSAAMGVRFVGYLDSVNKVEAGRFGS